MGIFDFIFGKTDTRDDYTDSCPKTQLNNATINFYSSIATYTGEATKFSTGIKPHGKGVAVLSNGDVFSGKFSYGYPREGKYRFANGTYCYVKYNSEYSINYSGPYGWRQPNEKNKYCEHKKDYVGELKNGVPDGIGEMKFDVSYFWESDEQYHYYVGGFKNGQKHGVGKYTYLDGSYDICVYKDGKEVCKLENYKQEKETKADNTYEEEESSSSSYIEEQFKIVEKKQFSDYIRNNETDLAKNILRNFDSDEEIEVYDSGYFVTKTVKEWEDELTK